ncbi:MAG TPA: SMP-30/gluconolactonase/LRE family protein [Planctomycetota bacterium]
MMTLFLLVASQVAFEKYAAAPGYSEGPTWRDGEVFFCSGTLLRVDSQKRVHRYLDIGPAGTVLLGDGHLLVCDNKHRALLDVTPDGRVSVVADQWEGSPLLSLNDLTVDARGNVYWTDPEGSSDKNPTGRIFRLRPDGRVDRLAANLAFPNGLDVDPASAFLYVVESQSKKILRYPLPADDQLLGKPEVFHDLGGSGGDGCAFDAAGNLWVADYHRPDTKTGRVAVLSPDGKVLAHHPVPSQVVSNVAFGGPNRDELFCTTADGVVHAKVGVKGFAGHPGQPRPVLRALNVVPRRPHPDAEALAKGDAAGVADVQLREEFLKLRPEAKRDVELLAEIKRLGGKATLEVRAPDWLRAIVGDEKLPAFARVVEIELNERTDGHKEPAPKAPGDRVTDAWLERLADQTELRRLELSGTGVTSAGLVHLAKLTNLERLNLCLTDVDDRGFEHLAGLTRMRRMTICASKITGTGFAHLGGMKRLESINLHSSPASDAGLAEIGKFSTLTRLEIVHTKVTDAGLAHLAGLLNLRQLHVHGPETTADALPFLERLRNLEQLDVYDRAASNQTLERIAKLPKLRKLMLVTGAFDDAGVRHLAGLPLEELTLDSPKVTDASIETLGSLKSLRKLRVKLSPAGRERLRELLPRAEIAP